MRRVFIMEDADRLRRSTCAIRGVIDSADLPLNAKPKSQQFEDIDANPVPAVLKPWA